MPSYEITGGPKPVTTKGSDATPLSFALTGPLAGRRVESVRVHVHIESDSGDIEVRVVYQVSNDLASWSSDQTIAGYTTYTSTDGWTYGATFATLTASSYMRFLVQAKNKTGGTEIDAARVTVLLDVRYG